MDLYELPKNNRAYVKSVFDFEHVSVLGFFATEWCGPCKAFEPEFMKAKARAERMQAEADRDTEEGEIPVHYGNWHKFEITNNEHKVYFSKFHIAGYPTVLVYVNSEKIIQYKGPRNANSLFEFVQNIISEEN